MSFVTHNKSHKPTVLLDLNHPTDFHFFREFIIESRQKGMSMYITVKQRQYLPELLKFHDVPYILKGKRAYTFWGKLIGLLREIYQLYLLARAIKPEVFISFASPYAAITGRLLRIPVIGFDDTECNPLLHQITPRFSDLIITPRCFQKSFGRKHIRFEGYKESVYLKEIFLEKNLYANEIPEPDQKEPFILVRFVSYHATHELGKKGLSPEEKEEIVHRLKQYHRVYISSEGPLPEKLKIFELKAPPAHIHHLLKNAVLYFGESTTMAAEAALLGTSAILVEDEGRGFTDDIEKRTGLLRRFSMKEWNQAVKHAEASLEKQGKGTLQEAASLAEIFSETTDIKELLNWIVQNPWEHIKQLKHTPDKINDFKSNKSPR